LLAPLPAASPVGGPAGSTALGAQRDRLLVPAAGLCLLVATAAYLVVFTLLGQIGASLQVSRTFLGWIVIATIITGSVSAALLPALGAAVGQRRLMVAAMGCLAAGSLVSATAPDGAALMIGRIIASLGFAAAPLGVAIVREHRSGSGLAVALGVIAAFEGMAAAVGFTLGGAVEQAARTDWRSVFVAMAVISGLAGVAAAAVIPGRASAPRRPDLAGAMLLAAGLVAALLPVTEGAAWGWASWRVVALLVIAVVLLSAWATSALARSDPLIQLRLLASFPEVAIGASLFVLTAATVGIVNLTVPPFLQAPPTAGYGGGASVLGAGLAMLPFALTITVAGFGAGALARRVSPVLIVAVTLSVEAAALGLLVIGHSRAEVVLLLALFGAGHGGSLAAEYVLITRSVPAQAGGPAMGLASAASGLGGAVASAVTTALLASKLVHVGTTTLPVSSGYSRAWACGLAVAVVGAVAAAITSCLGARAPAAPMAARR
jgi:MFS family permease